MDITWGSDNLRAQKHRSVATIGVFDGVHLGHQAIMRALRETACEHKARSVAVTFDRLPEETVRPGFAPPYITSISRKIELISRQGLDDALVLEADHKLFSMPAAEFVCDVLVEKLRVAEIVVGHSFVFGHGRTGNVELLNRMGSELGFKTTIVPPVVVDETIVSSTGVRRLIGEGEVELASTFLGRPFILDGLVIPGKGLGRQLGFPTANVEPFERQIIPANGVYAVEVSLRGANGRGVANIGTRPTFGAGAPGIEVYILGFSGDIYGEQIGVAFRHRLRDETRFPDAASLVKQIRDDVERAKALPERPASDLW